MQIFHFSFFPLYLHSGLKKDTQMTWSVPCKLLRLGDEIVEELKHQISNCKILHVQMPYSYSASNNHTNDTILPQNGSINSVWRQKHFPHLVIFPWPIDSASHSRPSRYYILQLMDILYKQEMPLSCIHRWKRLSRGSSQWLLILRG